MAMNEMERTILKKAYDTFEHASDEFYDVVIDIVGRMLEKGNGEDAQWEAIDEGLIYYWQQWEVLKHYCTPMNANWDDAYEEFSSDVIRIADIINEECEEDLSEYED